MQITSENVIVVTGFLHQELMNELENLPIQFAQNSDWADGMGSSIQTGINFLLDQKNAAQIDAVLFLLSDQPLVNSTHLSQLIHQFYLDKNSIIVASGYNGTQGVPAVFDKSLFPILQQLSGNGGAGSLFKKFQTNLTTVPFEKAAIDIDTEEDYKRLTDHMED